MRLLAMELNRREKKGETQIKLCVLGLGEVQCGAGLRVAYHLLTAVGRGCVSEQ